MHGACDPQALVMNTSYDLKEVFVFLSAAGSMKFKCFNSLRILIGSDV